METSHFASRSGSGGNNVTTNSFYLLFPFVASQQRRKTRNKRLRNRVYAVVSEKQQDQNVVLCTTFVAKQQMAKTPTTRK